MNKLTRNIFRFNPLTHQNKYNLYLHEYQAYEILKKYGVPLVPVIFSLSRASEPPHPKTLMLLPTDSCPRPQSPSLLLMSLSRLKCTQEEEAKVHSENLTSKAVSKPLPKPLKSWTMLKKCWEKH